MSRRLNAQTKMVAEILETMLDNGVGDVTPTLDDVASEVKNRIGGRHSAALALVVGSLRVTLAVMEERGWYCSKVTQHYVEKYRGLLGDAKHPTTDAEIIRCVAGAGHPWPAAALHFCTSDDCVLFMQTYCQNAKSGEAKVVRTVKRMHGMAESGLLTVDGITKIAGAAAIGPRRDVSKALRVAGRVGQQRLTAAS